MMPQTMRVLKCNSEQNNRITWAVTGLRWGDNVICTDNGVMISQYAIMELHHA